MRSRSTSVESYRVMSPSPPRLVPAVTSGVAVTTPAQPPVAAPRRLRPLPTATVTNSTQQEESVIARQQPATTTPNIAPVQVQVPAATNSGSRMLPEFRGYVPQDAWCNATPGPLAEFPDKPRMTQEQCYAKIERDRQRALARKAGGRSGPQASNNNIPARQAQAAAGDPDRSALATARPSDRRTQATAGRRVTDDGGKLSVIVGNQGQSTNRRGRCQCQVPNCNRSFANEDSLGDHVYAVHCPENWHGFAARIRFSCTFRLVEHVLGQNMLPQAFDLIPTEVEYYAYVRRFEAVSMRFAAHSLWKMGLAGKIRKSFPISVSPPNHLAALVHWVWLMRVLRMANEETRLWFRSLSSADAFDVTEPTIPRVGPTFEGNLPREGPQVGDAPEPVRLTTVNVIVSNSASLGAPHTVTDSTTVNSVPTVVVTTATANQTVADPTTVESGASVNTPSISASCPHGNAIKCSPGLVQRPSCCERTNAFATGVQPRTLATVPELPEDPLPVGPAKTFMSPPRISESESDMDVEDKTVVHRTPTKQILESGHAPEWADGISLDGTPGSLGNITDSLLDDDPTDNQTVDPITIGPSEDLTGGNAEATASQSITIEPQDDSTKDNATATALQDRGENTQVSDRNLFESFNQIRGSPRAEGFADAHFHLDRSTKELKCEPILESLLRKSAKSGAKRDDDNHTLVLAIANFCDPEKFGDVQLDNLNDSRLSVSFGVHPKKLRHAITKKGQLTSNVKSQLLSFLEDRRTVAFGEVGLDCEQGDTSDSVQQEEFLRKLLEAVKAPILGRRLPIVLHLRPGPMAPYRPIAEKAQKIIRDIFGQAHPIQLHCFRGTAEDVAFWMEKFQNCYFSIIGRFGSKEPDSEIVRMLEAIPTDRLLIETDAPYFGNASPLDVAKGVERVAKALNCETFTLMNSSLHNTRSLFNIQ